MFPESATAVTGSLDRKPGETWRDAEARMFLLLSRMMQGEFLRIQRFSSLDQRRLGYLAEVAALLLAAENEAELRAYADEVRRHTGPDAIWQPSAFVPGGTPGQRPQLDELAEGWGFHPGLDVGRYRSETPGLLLAQASGPRLGSEGAGEGLSSVAKASIGRCVPRLG